MDCCRCIVTAAQLALAADGRGGSRAGTAGLAGLARAVYGNSTDWWGIQEVRLLDTDEPVTELTVTSDSGVDFQVDFGFDPILRTSFDS